MSFGYDKLLEDTERDCNDKSHEGCFNPEGCNKKDTRVRCTHRYCDTFKWAVDRAKQYGEKLNVPWEEVLDSWEQKRSYWYMNYYQECNQPEISSNNTRVFETVDEMLHAIGEHKFRCPACGGISTDPYECNSGLEIEKGKTCDWKVYGLFRDMGKGVFVYCKDKLTGNTIFMPVSWEERKEA